jgi:hypothetical protein
MYRQTLICAAATTALAEFRFTNVVHVNPLSDRGGERQFQISWYGASAVQRPWPSTLKLSDTLVDDELKLSRPRIQRDLLTDHDLELHIVHEFLIENIA